MPTLHALLVAINDYPIKPLKGCIPDKNAMRDYLREHCARSGLAFNPLELENTQATREAILHAFNHYAPATPEDICLFYFAGHGSHYSVPDEFRHLEPDGEVETMVCYDSRLDGGRDLVSKELSYRLWEVGKNLKKPFITIMDCCHSGAFRSQSDPTDNDAEVVLRESPAGNWKASPDQFYGYSSMRTPEGHIRVPLIRRVHLGAARDLETAKEARIGSERRGIFTHNLLKILQQTKGQITYEELIQRVNHIIRRAVRDQSAQLQVRDTKDKKYYFLSDQQAGEDPVFLVSHDRELGWTVNAGAIYGIPPGDERQKTSFCLLDDNRQVIVTKVLPERSMVEPLAGYDQNRDYRARLEQLAEPRFQLAYAPAMPDAARKLLETALAEKKSDLFRITPNAAEADFLLQAKDGAFSLYRLEEQRAVGRPVKGLEEDSAIAFLNEVEIMLQWHLVLLMHNPATTIRDEELEITLNRVTEAGNFGNDTAVEPVDWRQPVLFEYEKAGGQWHQPAFQLHIKNTSNRQLSVSLLYLGENFSITNQLIQMQILEPGNEVWALDIADGHSYITIPLQVENHYLRRNRETIDEYFKLVVSTEPFETDRFNQDGIPWDEPDRSGPTRALATRGQVKRPDWRTFEIPVLIRRPKASL